MQKHCINYILLMCLLITSCGPSGYFRDADNPPPYVPLENLLTDFEDISLPKNELIVIKNKHFSCARLTPLGVGETPDSDQSYVELEFDIAPDGRSLYPSLKSFSEETMNKDAALSVKHSIGWTLNRYKPKREISNEEVRRTSRFFYVDQQDNLCRLADQCKLRSFTTGRSSATFHCKGMKKPEQFAGVDFPVTVDGYYRSNFKSNDNGVSMSYNSRSKIGFQEIAIIIDYANLSQADESGVYLNEKLDESHLQYFVKNGDGKAVEEHSWNYELDDVQEGRIVIYHFTDKAVIGTTWAGLLGKYVIQINAQYSDHYRTTMQNLMSNEDTPFFLKDAGLTASIKLIESLKLNELSTEAN